MMNNIVNENSLTFNRLEKEIYKYVCKEGCKYLASVLESMDNELSKNRDKSKYRNKGKRKTTIKTLMGEVEFSRTVYVHEKDGEKHHIYLLDQELGFDTIGLISTNLATKIVENASITSYRNTAKNVTDLTGQSISHTGAWNVIQALGEKVKQEEEQQVKAEQKKELTGEKEVPILFEEADGVYINIQGKDRPKSGKKLEMKVAVAYEGWKKVSSNRYELVNKIACAGFEKVSDFYNKKEAKIAKEYNKDEIKIRILNGDGARWIRYGEDENVYFQLDPFHKYQAVLRNVSNKEQRKELIKQLRENKVEEVLEKIVIYINQADDEKEEEKLIKLYKYFNENKEGLKAYQIRDINIPDPPEGLEYRNLGTMEHHICDIIALRMKHRKASWSIQGAENLGKLLAAKSSGKLYETINRYSKIILSENKTKELVQILSSSKTPKKDGKGLRGSIPICDLPFRDSKVTNGRKAIKDIFNIRNFNNLTYR